MDFYFENYGTNTYLVYAVKQDDALDTLSLGMLTNNKILGLAQTQFSQMDADKFIKYNVSARVSVKQFFEGPVNRKRLVGVFKGIINALISAEEYMIDANSIVIDLNYMFADVSTCDTVLICCPVEGVLNQQVDLGTFFKNIMFGTQFDQTENCDYVAKIINYLNGAARFSLNEFKNVLDSIDGNVATVSVSQKQPIAVKQPLSASQPVAPPIIKQPQTQKSEPRVNQPVVVAAKQSVAPAPKPQAQPVATPTRVQQNAPASNNTGTIIFNAQQNEEKMSWFYLLQHYNKENAEKYKAQKAARKNVGSASVSAQAKPQQKQANTNPGFAIPGQSNSSGFAIPGQPTPPSQPVTLVQNRAPQPKAQSVAPSAPVNPPAYIPIQVPQGQAANFGETTVLGGSAIGETTVLSVANNSVQSVVPYLIRSKNNEKILLNKPVFRIGKERSYVDYFVGDNTAISRSHANIVTRDGEYFVVDTNSTNHTFVNGTMINSNEEIKINHSDKIRLGNEEFEFKVY